jgi:hypothetical protein
MAEGDMRREGGIYFAHDQETEVGRIPPLQQEEGCLDRQAPQPGYVFNDGKSKAARARSSVLQKALTTCGGASCGFAAWGGADHLRCGQLRFARGHLCD